MKKIFYLLSLITILGCQNTKTENSEIEVFFDTMSKVECIDSLQNKFALTFKYSTFNQDKMSFCYVVPDSIQNSDFYNAYSGRMISAYYNLMNSDTISSFDNLLTLDTYDKDLVKTNVMNYCGQNQTWNGIFKLAHSSFYENKPIEKPIFTIDSLINISMSYFDIAGYSEERGFAFHFVCGSNPFDFKVENKTALLVCEFCKEALMTAKMNEVHQRIINEIENAIKREYETIEDFQIIKQSYEPMLYGLLKNEKALKESLIAYYEKRKNIEPFILEY